MITLNVEIRYTNSLRDAYSATRVSKEDIKSDIVDIALEVLTQMYSENGGITEAFMVVPSQKWLDLPDNLYLIEEYEGAPPITFVKTRKKIKYPIGEFIPLHLAFGPDTLFSLPDMTLDIHTSEM